MDKSKIKELKEKRKLLQEEIRLKKLRDRISFKINYLEEHNFDYKIFYKYENINWIDQNIKTRKKDGYYGIHEDFQIDVDDKEGINTKITTNGLLSNHYVKDFFAQISNETTFIICVLGGDPEIEISKEAFLSDPSVFLSNFENWVLSSDKKYIIERILEQDCIRFIDISQPIPILKVKTIIT